MDMHSFLRNSIKVAREDIKDQQDFLGDMTTAAHRRRWRSDACLLNRLEDEINAHEKRCQEQVP
jgi:hypothetical protein